MENTDRATRIALLSLLLLALMYRVTLAQSVPSWAEPAEPQAYEQTRDRYEHAPQPVQKRQFERVPAWAEENAYAKSNGRGSENNPYCRDDPSQSKCDLCDDPKYDGKWFCDLYDPSEVPIDNPYAMGLLLVMGASLAFWKLG